MPLPRAALAVAAALALAGCDRTPTLPTSQLSRVPASNRDASDDASPDAALPGSMQSVTGHYQFVGIGTLNNFKYSIAAIRHEDGSVSGEVEERTVFDPTGDFVRSMHGDVKCFTIVGNMAFIAGIVDRVESLAPNQENLIPGAFFRLVVVDNGNGDDAPPDMGSNVRFGDPRLPQFQNMQYCNFAPFNLQAIDHGNITVRP